MRGNISRQIAGENARLLPPGHSSALKIIGQFSIAIFTPRSAACATSGGQTSSNAAQLSSIVRVRSRPTNVPTVGTPSRWAASMTFVRWGAAGSRAAGSASSGFG